MTYLLPIPTSSSAPGSAAFLCGLWHPFTICARVTGDGIQLRSSKVSGIPRLCQFEVDPRRPEHEFGSKDLDLWAYLRGIELDVSRRGKLTNNAFIESVNGKFRADACRGAPVPAPCRQAAKMRAWASRLQCHSSPQHDRLRNSFSTGETLTSSEPALSVMMRKILA